MGQKNQLRLTALIVIGLLIPLGCNTLTGGTGDAEPTNTNISLPTSTERSSDLPTSPIPTSTTAPLTPTPESDDDNPADATAIPVTVEPAETEEEPSNLLFSDDFSDTSSGWDRVANIYGLTDYYQGGYRIQVASSTYIKWANPRKTFGDVRVEVDAELIDGSANNSFGIICRYQDAKNFYALVISSDGYYAIRKRANTTDLIILSGEAFQESIWIDVGQSAHHITVECIGDTLSLYVDGNLIDEVQDSEFEEGDVGLLVSTMGEASTDILFDNFEVYPAP